RVGALPANRQRTPVADPLVGRDLDLALDLLRHLSAEVALDLVVTVDVLADPDDLLLGEVPDLGTGRDARAVDDLGGARGTDAVDVAKRDVHPLLAGEVDAGDPCHLRFPPIPVAAC